jgi:hypothetical protein
MKKRLFLILATGLTLIGSARSASAVSSLPATPNVTIDNQAIPVPAIDPLTGQPALPVATPVTSGSATPTALTAPAATGVSNPTSGAVLSNITSAISSPVSSAIQTAGATLTNFAAQQTSGISNLPLVGNQINSAIQQQISAGIGNLTTMATTGFANLLANTPLAGISSAIGSVLNSLGLGGGNSNPNTANAQAAAQNAAIQSTVASYQAGAAQAAATLARQATPDIGSIEIDLANLPPDGGNIATTVSNVQGQQAVAGITLNSNPSNGSLSQLDAISSSAHQVVAQSANGVAGQADLQSRVSKSSLNAAGMQSQGTQTFDNSLDQLNAISQQLGQQGGINAESVRIAAEQRTLTAAQLAQSANEAKARIRKEQGEEGEKQAIHDGVLNGRAALTGMVGLTSTTPATPAPPTASTTPAATSVLITN